MLIYPSFIYLQNQKTGCTFVETCLRKFCSEPLLQYRKHATLTDMPNKFCFINVRQPIDLYRSLYAYGVDGKGEIYFRLKHYGYSHLYEYGLDGFTQWLDFMTRPNHSQLLDNSYTPSIAQKIGFMTWRFLRLACVNFQKSAPMFDDITKLSQYVKTHYVINTVLRQEKLTSDLKTLLQTQLAHCIKSQADLEKWLAEAPKINVSKLNIYNILIEDELMSRVQHKEFFLYKNFYRDQL